MLQKSETVRVRTMTDELKLGPRSI